MSQRYPANLTFDPDIIRLMIPLNCALAIESNMIRKFAIAGNVLGTLCCIGIFYVYLPVASALFDILFNSNVGSVAIIGGDETSPGFSIFLPIFYTIAFTIIFLTNLFVLTRKVKH
jgi:hypothetical protein